MTSPRCPALALFAAVLFAFLLAVPPARAQSFQDARPGEPEWGTDATQVLTLHAMGFVPSASFIDYSSLVDSTGLFRVTVAGQPGTFYAFLALPSGALVTAVEIDGCDEDLSGSLWVGIFKDPKGPTVGHTYLVDGATGITPGCQSFPFYPGQPFTIDNEGLSYAVDVHLELANAANALRFKAVRIYYNLQVSPAPATATFVDVPKGYWAFRHIEALAASGITAGCGGGAFCPEDPLTRAQMAVFLAKALGLHWE